MSIIKFFKSYFFSISKDYTYEYKYIICDCLTIFGNHAFYMLKKYDNYTPVTEENYQQYFLSCLLFHIIKYVDYDEHHNYVSDFLVYAGVRIYDYEPYIGSKMFEFSKAIKGDKKNIFFNSIIECWKSNATYVGCDLKVIIDDKQVNLLKF